ncbi:MAG: RDD family protein, partial [Chloroflexi bacterium]|nr:RDD family protein [Chloroflexota bacterium]
KCPQCGAENAPNYRFCRECGAPLQRTCPQCGQEVEPGVKFCPYCGQRLTTEAPAQSAAAPATPPPAYTPPAAPPPPASGSAYRAAPTPPSPTSTPYSTGPAYGPSAPPPPVSTPPAYVPPSAPPPPTYGAPPAFGPTTSGYVPPAVPTMPAFQYKGVWPRFFAALIDGVILGIPMYLLMGAIVMRGMSSGNVNPGKIYGPTFLVSLISIAYYIVLEAYGGTLGKRILGMRIVDANGNKPGFGKSLIRNLLRIVDGLFGYIVGAIIVASSPTKQRLGDKVAGTFVVGK